MSFYKSDNALEISKYDDIKWDDEMLHDFFLFYYTSAQQKCLCFLHI